MPRLFSFLPVFHLASLVLMALVAVLPAASVAAPARTPLPLVLNDAVTMVDLWPAVTILHDPDGKLTIEDLLAAPAGFEVPKSAYATLGMRQKVVWLRVPVSVPLQSNGRWILDLDYTLLNRVDVFVASGGRVVRHAVLGNALPFSQRPIASRSHAVILELPPGNDYQLMLRVDTIGSMILPVSLRQNN